MEESGSCLSVKNVTFYLSSDWLTDDDVGYTPVWTIDKPVSCNLVETREVNIEQPWHGWEEANCSIEMNFPKHLRCKSRKRFIKLIMSLGIQRNTANFLANDVAISDTSYGDFWINLCFRGIEYLAKFKIHKDDLLPRCKILIDTGSIA